MIGLYVKVRNYLFSRFCIWYIGENSVSPNGNKKDRIVATFCLCIFKNSFREKLKLFLIPTRSVVKNSNRWWQEANLLEQVGTLLLVTIFIEDLVPVKSGLYSCPNNFPRELAVCHGKGVTLFLKQIIFFNIGALFARVLLHQNQSTGNHNGYSGQRKISQLKQLSILQYKEMNSN